jgi:hypothetical protein
MERSSVMQTPRSANPPIHWSQGAVPHAGAPVVRRLYALVLILVGAAPAFGQIPPGFEVIDIVRHDEYKRWPRINECGEVVFAMNNAAEHRLAEIYLYDNGKITRVSYSNGTGAGLPDINDAGVIVWEGNRRDLFDPQVMMLRDGQVINLGPGINPVVNSGGAVAWSHLLFGACFEAQVYLYDGQSTRAISDAQDSHQGQKLNDLTEAVWTAYRFCESPWDSDILMYREGQVLRLTTDQFESQAPSINKPSQVVWAWFGGLDLWEDGKTRRLSSETYNAPYINDEALIASTKWDNAGQNWHAWLIDANSDPAEFRQLTNASVDEVPTDINGRGEIVWQESTGATFHALRQMRRIRNGESDFDGDVDLDDAASLHDCLTGPGDFDRLCDCRFLDIDHDRDVDLGDFALFQRNYTGSK